MNCSISSLVATCKKIEVNYFKRKSTLDIHSSDGNVIDVNVMGAFDLMQSNDVKDEKVSFFEPAEVDLDRETVHEEWKLVPLKIVECHDTTGPSNDKSNNGILNKCEPVAESLNAELCMHVEEFFTCSETESNLS